MKNQVLIVVSNYYKEISNNLILGATNFLDKKEVGYKIIYSPGSFDIPFIINNYINNEAYEGFIALGCIIRGETYHFELIANECARKIMDLSIENNKPIGFGILTCENLDQAIERSDPNKFNKGKEAAKACIELINQSFINTS